MLSNFKCIFLHNLILNFLATNKVKINKNTNLLQQQKKKTKTKVLCIDFFLQFSYTNTQICEADIILALTSNLMNS